MSDNLNNDELTELLRYFVGTPPYLQDARFRDLVNRFEATDERPQHTDDRMSTYDLQRQDVDEQTYEEQASAEPQQTDTPSRPKTDRSTFKAESADKNDKSSFNLKK